MIDVQTSEDVWSLKGLTYDLACKHCWKAGEEVTPSEAEEADDSELSAFLQRQVIDEPRVAKCGILPPLTYVLCQCRGGEVANRCMNCILCSPLFLVLLLGCL